MATADELAAALAREIREAVAETETAPTGSEHRLEHDGDHFVEIRTPLDRAERYLTPAVPDASRLAGAKSAALRLLRFLWRGQASFNALSLEAARETVGALERTRTAIEKQARRFDELARELAGIARRDSAQDGRISYLESASSRSPDAAPAAAPPGASLPESVYALFEERFRGSPEEVARRQAFYLPFLAGVPGPVFDAGCGRGEFLRLLSQNGVAARGVETSRVAVEKCRAAGLDVQLADAVEALSETPAATLGAVVAFQVVEHWPAATTFRFLVEARRAVAPGGVLIVETVNTDSLSAMKAFYLDPTHVRPVPPEALLFLCDAAGFRDLAVEYLSPLPDSERLTERSDNDARLNRLLFGPQDYAVRGRVPSG
jgi:SAM-dependent methyltransferase